MYEERLACNMPLEHFIYMRRDPLLEPSKTECLSIGTFLDCQSTVNIRLCHSWSVTCSWLCFHGPLLKTEFRLLLGRRRCSNRRISKSSSMLSNRARWEFKKAEFWRSGCAIWRSYGNIIARSDRLPTILYICYTTRYHFTYCISW